VSIRFRLTVLYSAIVALTIIAFSISLYLVVSSITFDLASSSLTSETTSFASTFVGPRPARFGNGQSVPAIPLDLASPEPYAQLVQIDGTIISQSHDLQAANLVLPLDMSVRQRIADDPNVRSIESTIVLSGTRYLLCVVPIAIQFRSPPVAILQMARSLHDVDQTLSTLRNGLFLGGILVTIIAFGAGWVLSGAALRPINRITRTARAIGVTQDFDRRVDYVGPQDEIGRLAGTFNTMLNRLQAAFQAQKRFVADASHELRTPLTTIRGNLGLLQRDPPIAESDRTAVLEDMVSESERLSRLVSDLLTLARSDAGRPMRNEQVELVPLVEDVVRKLAVLHPDRLIHEETADMPVIAGDRDAVTQVLYILLDNALKFTPANGSVTVSVLSRDKSATLVVRDTGAGIARAVLPHIFDRFYQGDTARAGSGSGLGLAIAKVLVEGQNGNIGVESQEGRGTTFTVTLPCWSGTAREPVR
jgi:signal transduction histidine kinase